MTNTPALALVGVPHRERERSTVGSRWIILSEVALFVTSWWQKMVWLPPFVAISLHELTRGVVPRRKTKQVSRFDDLQSGPSFRTYSVVSFSAHGSKRWYGY